MKTLIVNGSPNGKNGNTEAVINHFMAGSGQTYPVRYVAYEPAEKISEELAQAETILLFMPLYVHAMPGIVMRLFEQMQQAKRGQKIGFVIQQGFVETAQARFLKRYLEQFAQQMGFDDLGVVIMGDCAGMTLMPQMYKKIFAGLHQLGAGYGGHGTLDTKIAAQLGGMYEIPRYKANFFEFLHQSGINHIFWHRFWKENGVSKQQGLDRPFQRECGGNLSHKL